MNDTKVRSLINQYITGWEKNNLKKILSVLSDDCEIIESHGPVYRGLNEVQEWVKRWIKGDWKVDCWDINSFLGSGDRVVFEWIFTFSSQQTNPRTIAGITIAKIKNGKIVYLREYRTTKPLYDWSLKKKLTTY